MKLGLRNCNNLLHTHSKGITYRPAPEQITSSTEITMTKGPISGNFYAFYLTPK